MQSVWEATRQLTDELIRGEEEKDWHPTIFSANENLTASRPSPPPQHWCGRVTVGHTSLVTAAPTERWLEPARTTIIISISPPPIFFHESVRINSAALYKIRIPQGDGTYLYIIWIPSELRGHIRISAPVLGTLKGEVHNYLSLSWDKSDVPAWTLKELIPPQKMHCVHLFVVVVDGILQYFDGGSVTTQNRQEFFLAFL